MYLVRIEDLTLSKDLIEPFFFFFYQSGLGEKPDGLI